MIIKNIDIFYMIADKALYEKIKKKVYALYDKPSAYRSGRLVAEYKKAGGRYIGAKPKNTGLSRWYKEDWRNQRGGKGYKKKGDIYRPTKRITSKTPTTMKELGKKRIKKAIKKKRRTGRVDKF